MSSAAVSSKGVQSTEGEAIESCFRKTRKMGSITDRESLSGNLDGENQP